MNILGDGIGKRRIWGLDPHQLCGESILDELTVVATITFDSGCLTRMR